MRIISSYRDVVRIIPALLATVLLHACTYTVEQVATEPEGWQQRIEHNSTINAWTVQARLGIQSETEGGSFDLYWEETPAAYNIRMIAPMGMGAAQIRGDKNGVSLKMADGREQFSDDADELFATMTGLTLPVNGLRDWIRGMPMHDVALNNPVWNAHDQLHKLSQVGWRVEMNKYRKVDTFELPHAFYLEREEGPELAVRLLVRRWQPNTGHTDIQ